VHQAVQFAHGRPDYANLQIDCFLGITDLIRGDSMTSKPTLRRSFDAVSYLLVAIGIAGLVFALLL
jgi:hypothetical protein